MAFPVAGAANQICLPPLDQLILTSSIQDGDREAFDALQGQVATWKLERQSERVLLKQAIGQPEGVRRDIRRIGKNLEVNYAHTKEELFTHLIDKTQQGRSLREKDIISRIAESCKSHFLYLIQEEKDAYAALIEEAKCRIVQIKQNPDSLETLWFQFHWEKLQGTIDAHPNFARFLKKTGLMFDIAGYQRTLDATHAHTGDFTDSRLSNLAQGIRLDHDRHPMILQDNTWVRWERIEASLDYDETRKKIITRGHPDQEWIYKYPVGLSRGTRFNDIRPVYRLSPGEMHDLKTHGQRFFETRTDTTPQIPKNCYLQLYTSIRDDNLLGFSHVGVRVIDEAGAVYSIGWEIPEDLQHTVTGSILGLASTQTVNITSLDYDEFRRFDQRRVTTIPMTQAAKEAILAQARTSANTYSRFNYIRQNCMRFALQMLTLAGVNELDTTTTVGELIWDVLLKKIPYIGAVLERIVTIVATVFTTISRITPEPIKAPFRWCFTTLFYVPNKIMTLFSNLIILACGGASGGEPLPDDVVDNLDNQRELTTFRRLISNWTDLFKEDTGRIYSPLKLAEWQTQQRSNHMHVYDGAPKFYIVPPRAAATAGVHPTS